MRVLVIDGLNFIRRIFSAVPDHTPRGNAPPTNHSEGVRHAVINSAARAINQHQVSHAVAVFDSNEPTWRHHLFPPYKSQRKPPPAELSTLLPELKADLSSLGIASYTADGYEADDTIATIATQLDQRGIECIILTSDRLICQLLSPTIRIFDHFSKAWLDAAHIRKRFDVSPSQLPLYFALVGQSSLSVPGLAGIGAKTAALLLNSHQTEYELRDAASEQKPQPKWAISIQSQADALDCYLELFSLKRDIPLNTNLKNWRLPHE